MSTLNDWKNNSVTPWHWPVNSVTDDTDGLAATEYVIYDGVAKQVKKSSTATGAGTAWGNVTTVTATSVVGKTLGAKKYFFRITCPGGTLKGELSQTVLAPLDSQDHPEGHPVDPTPGSWTAAEGSGGHRHQPPEREERERLAFTVP